MSLLKNILFSIFSLQEIILKKRLSKTIGAKQLSNRKKHYSNGVLINIDSIAESEKKKMEEELELILKSSNYDPKEVLKYIEVHDTNVYYINNSKYLHSIGENEGFIYPQKGAKALYLSLLTDKKFKLKTKEMFILSKGEINQYYFIYHFYNWYAFKHGILGLDSDSQALLNKYLFTDSDTKNLHLSEIYKLKDAIKQDRAAIEFVVKLCQKYEGSKNALKKVKDNGANI